MDIPRKYIHTDILFFKKSSACCIVMHLAQQFYGPLLQNKDCFGECLTPKQDSLCDVKVELGEVR